MFAELADFDSLFFDHHLEVDVDQLALLEVFLFFLEFLLLVDFLLGPPFFTTDLHFLYFLDHVLFLLFGLVVIYTVELF